MLHWLVDTGKVKLEENVANIWPEFGSNGKDAIKVHHVLNHTCGLHNAMADVISGNPLHMFDWDDCLEGICNSVPETMPGKQQLYHYLTYGWLCGGIIEHASGKKFQEVLEEAIVTPLNLQGELYIGIPPGVESRLATLTVDTDDLSKISTTISNLPGLPSTLQPHEIRKLATFLPPLFNMLNIRRAIVPAANAHVSARALARYYAALADSGNIPPPHSPTSNPPLGSHPHIPNFSSHKSTTKNKTPIIPFFTTPKTCNYQELKDIEAINTSIDEEEDEGSTSTSTSTSGNPIRSQIRGKVFENARIVDEFMGIGEYEKLVLSGGSYGLGFKRFCKEGSAMVFGHSGMGGSTGFCDAKNRFAIAVTVNKMSLGTVTAKIVQLVCSELKIGVPDEFLRFP